MATTAAYVSDYKAGKNVALGCSKAISLDGGSSTGIRGHKYGTDFTWGATSTNVLSAVTVNPDSWV